MWIDLDAYRQSSGDRCIDLITSRCPSIFPVEEGSSFIILDFPIKIGIPLLENREWYRRIRSVTISNVLLIVSMSLRELDVSAKRMQIVEQLLSNQLILPLVSSGAQTHVLHDPLRDLPHVDITHDLLAFPFPLEGDDERFELVDRRDGYAECGGF